MSTPDFFARPRRASAAARPAAHRVLTRRRAAGLILGAIASAALVACGDPPGGGMPKPTGTPQVGVVELKAERVALTTELPGRVAAAQSAEVRPQVGGLLRSRRFREGSDVKAGELLYEIDPAPYRATLASSQAALAKAEANVGSARLKAGRYRELAAIQAVSQQDADDAQAALQQAEADVASAKAAVDSARINLDYTRITAPISGRIGRSSVTPGALVTASQSAALATIQQIDRVYVDVTQSSTALLRLKRAMDAGALSSGSTGVTLRLEDGSRYAHAGRLQFSELSVDTASGSVTLRADVPNPEGLLLPGMYVRAVVEEGVLDQAVLVPQPAVSRDPTGRAQVLVVGADQKVALRPIEVERTVGDRWLVRDAKDGGLQPGERVVVEGGQKLRPGAAVETHAWQGATPPAARVATAGTATAGVASAGAAPASSATVQR